MSGISGAQANHAKKQTKNAIHVRWKARIGGVRRLKRSIRVALFAIFFPEKEKASRETDHRSARGTPLSKSFGEGGCALLRLLRISADRR
jgi:hypothetical protein